MKTIPSATDQGKAAWRKLQQVPDGAPIVVAGDVSEKESTRIRVQDARGS